MNEKNKRFLKKRLHFLHHLISHGWFMALIMMMPHNIYVFKMYIRLFIRFPG